MKKINFKYGNTYYGIGDRITLPRRKNLLCYNSSRQIAQEMGATRWTTKEIDDWEECRIKNIKVHEKWNKLLILVEKLGEGSEYLISFPCSWTVNVLNTQDTDIEVYEFFTKEDFEI